MEKSSARQITLEGNIDRRSFLRFALFDSFIRKKGWRNPLLFALILSGFAAVCFAAQKTRPQAALLGGVLLGVGLLLPLLWIGMYIASVLQQAKRSGLSPARVQYTVTLSPEKIHVANAREEADFLWDDVDRAYRVKGCIYLYVSATRAFLLPDGANTEKAWAMLAERLGPEKAQRRADV